MNFYMRNVENKFYFSLNKNAIIQMSGNCEKTIHKQTKSKSKVKSPKKCKQDEILNPDALKEVEK